MNKVNVESEWSVDSKSKMIKMLFLPLYLCLQICNILLRLLYRDVMSSVLIRFRERLTFLILCRGA